jgi:nucleoside-diphosphate-sugar epimerase
MSRPCDVYVLGAGYLGAALCLQARHRGLDVLALGRSAAPEALQAAAIPFRQQDLPGAGLPDDLPGAAAAILTFPLAEPGPARRLMSALRGRCERVIYVNTTGVYLESRGLAVDEASPVLASHGRVPGEAIVLEHGGTSLRSAGFYGGARNPMRWIENGILRNGLALINLVHRDDLAAVLLELALLPRLPPVINCSDGRPLTRLRLFELYAELHPAAAPRVPEPAQDRGKLVRIGLLRGLLPPTFTFRDSLRAIRAEWLASRRL